MYSQMRRYVAAVMVGLLLVTSQSAAVARGGGVTGQMVLCSGSGLVTVFTDANGQPTGAPHVCPDAVLGFVVALAMPDPAASLDRVALRLDWPERAHLTQDGPAPIFQARAPPVAA